MKATAIWTAAYHINRVHGWLRRCGISRCMADEIGRDLHDKHILSPAQLRQIKDFWRPYWKVNPLFFKFYTEKYGQFSPEFIPNLREPSTTRGCIPSSSRTWASDWLQLYAAAPSATTSTPTEIPSVPTMR